MFLKGSPENPYVARIFGILSILIEGEYQMHFLHLVLTLNVFS